MNTITFRDSVVSE